MRLQLFPTTQPATFVAYPKPEAVLTEAKVYARRVLPVLRIDSSAIPNWGMPFDPVFFVNDVSVDELRFKIGADGYQLIAPTKVPRISEYSEIEVTRQNLTSEGPNLRFSGEASRFVYDDRGNELWLEHRGIIKESTYDHEGKHLLINKRASLFPDRVFEQTRFVHASDGVEVISESTSEKLQGSMEVTVTTDKQHVTLSMPRNVLFGLGPLWWYHDVQVGDRIVHRFDLKKLKRESDPNATLLRSILSLERAKAVLADGESLLKAGTYQLQLEQDVAPKSERSVYRWDHHTVYKNGEPYRALEFAEAPAEQRKGSVFGDRVTVPVGQSPFFTLFGGLAAKMASSEKESRHGKETIRREVTFHPNGSLHEVVQMRFLGESHSTFSVTLGGEPAWRQSPNVPRCGGKEMTFIAQLHEGGVFGDYYLFADPESGEVAQIFQCT